MLRILVLACLLALATAPPALAGSPPQAPETAAGRGWAEKQIRIVVAAGALAPTVAAFRPDDPITRLDLHEALTALGLPSSAPSDPGRLVTIRELDARLVASVGLLESARTIRLAAREAGLQPRDLLGTETVARLLGLRVNHPQGWDHLELQPRQPATRAEAAYSLATAVALTDAKKTEVARNAAAFSLSALSEWQRSVLARAIRFVGYPYVWAGMSERRQLLYYGEAPAGFDCSGLVWRVYKLEPFTGLPPVGDTLRGRTTFAMSAEVGKADRIGLVALQPGDLVFFGARGTRSASQEVNHMGIYAGNGWFVHSSGNGVTLQPLQGWYLQRFAWGRRPLQEAGLA
jgi:cell wall-associated NlpC family hydrolase